MDHLACFAGGMFGLAAHEEKDENSDRYDFYPPGFWIRIRSDPELVAGSGYTVMISDPDQE